MKKALLILAGVLALTVIAGGAALLLTKPGRALIADVAEDAISEAIGYETDIGRLEGSLPGNVILTDVTVSDEQGQWLAIERIEIGWRPLSLASGHINLRDVAIEHAALLRTPGPKAASADDQPRRIAILNDAPHLTIEAFELTDAEFPFDGRTHRMDGAGAARLNGPEIALRLTLTSDGASDQADITIEKSSARNRLFIDASAHAEPGGALATLLDLRAPLRMQAGADGALNDAAIEISGVVGNFGAIEASVRGDLRRFTGADITGVLTPGSRLADITELAGPVRLNAHYETTGDGGVLNIRSLAASAGDLAGVVMWQAEGGVVERADADLQLRFAPEYRPELQTFAGHDAALQGRLEWRDDAYELNAAVTAGRAKISIANGRTDLRNNASGDVAIDLAETDLAALSEGLAVTAFVDIAMDSGAAVSRLRAETPQGARLAGEGRIAFADLSATFSGEALLPEAVIESLNPELGADGPVTGDLSINGTVERFELAATFETPRLSLNEGAMPPLQIEAGLAGLPRLPNGEIKARARDGGPRRFDATLRSSVSGAVRAESLRYEGRDFRLSGKGFYDHGGKTLELDLDYSGSNNAEPAPGLRLAGDLQASGVLSRQGALTRMRLSGETVALNEISAQGLTLSAEGPPGALSFDLDAAKLAIANAPTLSDLTLDGVADIRNAPVLSLRTFSAEVAGLPATMTSPAKVSFGNGVAVEGLRLSYGSTGRISLDGAFSGRRWRADLNVADAPIPDADGVVTASLDLDTDRSTPAVGSFDLRTLLLGDTAAAITGDVRWTGEQLAVNSNQDGLNLNLKAPLRLTRAPALSVSSKGALAGNVRYEGDIAVLAAYMPPALQTIDGALSADFTISGSMNKPIVKGEARLIDGSYVEPQSGFALTHLNLRAATATDQDANGIMLSGGARGAEQSGADTLTFEGALRFGENSALDLAMKLDGAEFVAFPVTRARIDGEASITGPLNDLSAKGAFDVQQLQAEIVTPKNESLVPIDIVNIDDAASARSGAVSSIDYEIALSADNNVLISGRGVDSEWRADVTIFDGRNAPLVLGEMRLLKGALDFAGRRFDMTRGVIRFDRYSPNNPTLDLRAEYEANGVTAAIVVSGRAQSPDVSLTATGASSEDAMAIVMFGKPLSELSVTEAAQSAEALAALTGQGVFGGDTLTGKLKRTIGLDLLNVDLDPETGGSVTVGKEVVNGVFVSAKQDIQGDDGAIRVKANVTRNITVETEIEQSGEQTVSANWKKDF